MGWSLVWEDDDYFGDDADEYWDDPWADYDADAVVSSVNPVSNEQNMSAKVVAGDRFFTSNRVVGTLPEGSILQAVGAGEVEVLDVPKPEFKPGDRIVTHHGPSTVVRKSSRIKINDYDKEAELLYVADSEPVTVRRINRDEVDFV